MNGRTNSNGTTTDTIQIPLDPVTNLDAVAGNAQVTLTWTDPLNKYATPEGEQADDPDQLVSVWLYTAIVRKEGSAPTGIHDGILVAESQVHNQYQTNGYVDSGLTNDTLYYYGLFAVNEDGIESEVTTISAMPKAGTPVRDLTVGTIININEDGIPIEYLIVNQGIPENSSLYDLSCNGTWVLRKDIAEEQLWNLTDDVDYEGSGIHSYLNGTFLNRYDNNTKGSIKQVKIPHHDGITYGGSLVSGVNGLSCKIFLLSRYEVGFTDDDTPDASEDGAKLSYFDYGTEDTANAKRRAYYALDEYNTTGWWLRSIAKSYGTGTNVVVVLYSGRNYWMSNGPYGVRPAFVLDPSARVDQYFNLITK